LLDPFDQEQFALFELDDLFSEADVTAGLPDPMIRSDVHSDFGPARAGIFPGYDVLPENGIRLSVRVASSEALPC
jgi:hypothetical protein